jgi:hypothetical protein
MLTSERTGLNGAALTLVRIAVSAALAAASFRFVEDPIRHRVTWVRDRRGIPALAGAVVLVATTLIVLPHPQREIAAFDPGSITVPAAQDPAAQRPAAQHDVSLPTVGPPSPHVAAPTTGVPITERPIATTSRSTVALATPYSSIETSPITLSANTVSTMPVSFESAAGAIVMRRPISNVLWTGDSIAYDLAPGVGAALTSAGLVANSSAYPGMRIVGDDQFGLLPQLRTELPGSGVDALVVQLSMWDAERDPADQRTALDELHALAVASDALLVIVSPPPTENLAIDHGLAGLTSHARAIAAEFPTTAVFLDSAAVWGPVFDVDLDDDGTPERKRDGAHVCPSGAARFALWLTGELAARFDGATPTPPTEWAMGSWVTDGRYDEPVGSCAPLSD